MKNLLIIGAGVAGTMVAKEITVHSATAKKYTLLGFLDDNLNIKEVDGIQVFGRIADALKVVDQHNIDEIIIAIPSANRETMDKIISKLVGVKARIRIVPGLFEIIEGDVSLNQIRDIEPADLLGREEVGFDTEEMDAYFKNKTVFVTGAGGSIGSEIVIQLLDLSVKKVIGLGRGENSIHNLIQKVGNDKRFEYIIGDIRDLDKLVFEMNKHKPRIIFHTAAHKHVPLMENYPDEAVKNNVFGTLNCIIASKLCRAERFVLVSTDKAVNPSSVMGASKRIAEYYTLSYEKIIEDTKFSLVRFGNVLASRGSVVPVFLEQIKKGGPVTVVHKDVSRYFMSIREAARLVIKSATINDGNIFMLDMGEPVKILNLAQKLIEMTGNSLDDIPIVFTGMRSGDKMGEELSYSKEDFAPTKYKKLLVSKYDGDIPNLIEFMKDVQEAINMNDNERVVEILREYVSDYEPAK